MRKKIYKLVSLNIVLLFAGILCFQSYKASYANKTSVLDWLIQENTLALSEDGYVDNMVKVRYARDGYCWKSHTNYSDCDIITHDPACQFYTKQWTKDHTMYQCMYIPVERYINGPGHWTLCENQDEQCSGHKSNNQPQNEQGHTLY